MMDPSDHSDAVQARAFLSTALADREPRERSRLPAYMSAPLQPNTEVAYSAAFRAQPGHMAPVKNWWEN
eukprot:5603026-Pyramimonas_sp.AAC.1